MDFFRIKNWERFQHYKERNPPWIKFHTVVLDDPQIYALSEPQRCHLFQIWLLAARTGNLIPYDPDFVANRIGAKSPVDLEYFKIHGFIYLASGSLAESEQDDSNLLCSVEERREEKRHTESRASKMLAPTPEEISAEIRIKGYGRITTQRFFEFYAKKGWMVGKSPMRNWKIALAAADREWDAPRGSGSTETRKALYPDFEKEAL